MAALKSFDDASVREHELTRLAPRLLPIEVRRIVGSVSAPKVEGLDKDFLPRKDGANAPRYRSVLKAMQDDVPLPPIEVYALRGKYYVVDGHHRVAAARTLRYLYLDALVHEFLLPATSAANRLHNERVHFERLTGLTDIVLTETGGYRKLGSQIREHRFFLGEHGRPAGFKDAAADWYEYVYAPVTERLATSGILARFADRTVADLYIYVCDYKWVKSQNKGMDIGFPKALADYERLYGPGSSAGHMGHAGRVGRLGRKSLLRTLRPLTAPVVEATREWTRATRRDKRPAPDASDAEADPVPMVCPLCGETIEDGENAVCGNCA